MPVVFDKPKVVFDEPQKKVVFDNEPSRVVFDNEPSMEGVAKQFIIGAGNSALFSVPELIAGEKNFEKVSSDVPVERISRGIGTAVGFTVGLPGVVFKAGSKIATKGLAKVAPKFIKAATPTSKVVQAMIEGAGGGGLYNAVDPTTPLEDKPKNVMGGIAGGATMGLIFHQLPKAIQSIAKKNKRISKKTTKAINEAIAPTDPRAQLVPSIKRQIPVEAKSLIKELEARQTEILAADRGILPAKTQVKLSKNIDAGKILDSWKPGNVVNAESLFATRINLTERLLKISKDTPKGVVEKLSQDFIKADAMASELGRGLGSLNRPQSMAAEQLKFITENFKTLDIEAQEAAKRVFKQFKTPGFWDKFMEFRTAGLLTSPYTQERNLLGNSIGRFYRIPEKIIAGGVDAVQSKLTGMPRSRFAKEGVADFVGMVHGFRPAMKNALKALQDETFVSDSRIMEAVRFNRAIPGMVGKVIRFPFRALNAVDEFWNTLGHSASLYSHATRQAIKENTKNLPSRIAELVKNPTVEMIGTAGKESLVDTFRQPLGGSARNIQSALQKTYIGKFIVPFFRTPVNLFKWSFQRGPTGIVSPANWKAIMKGSAEQRAEAVARIGLGQLMSAGLFMQALDGNITGKLSNNSYKRDTLMRQGIMPYSIKIGNKYVSYRSYEPISSILALVANTSEIVKEKNSSLDLQDATTITMETVKMLKDQSFLRGLGDLFNALDDPDRYGQTFAQNSVTSLLPTGIGYAARLYDPVIREPDSIPESIKSRLPYFSKGVPPKLDVWGNVITKEGTLAQRAFNPSGVVTSRPSLTEKELLSLEKFPRKITKNYRGLNLTNKERNEVTQVEGKIIKRLLDTAITLPEYQSANPEDQSKIIDRVFSEVRTKVRGVYLNRKFLERLRSLTDSNDRIELIEKFTNKKVIKK